MADSTFVDLSSRLVEAAIKARAEAMGPFYVKAIETNAIARHNARIETAPIVAAVLRELADVIHESHGQPLDHNDLARLAWHTHRGPDVTAPATEAVTA